MTDEPALYEPPSSFLQMLLNEQIGLDDDAFGNANLAKLIRLTRDADAANRDWAVFLLSTSERDTPSVRTALRWAMQDEVEVVRLEALVGVAKREPAFALPSVAELLQADWISETVFEAASYVADVSLLPMLLAIADMPESTTPDGFAALHLKEALESCASGVPQAWRDFDL